MLGGDVKAFTILGIDAPELYDEDDEDQTVKYLILDPHYTGTDTNVKEILKKGWCGWKDPLKHFSSGYFYNLCMP
jgi:Ufm1-specific protease 2